MQEPNQATRQFPLVSQMTALTRLTIGVCSTAGFSSLGNCCQLQTLELVLADYEDKPFELSTANWEVIGQLSKLTTLRMWSLTVGDADCEVCLSALQQLTALRDLAAEAWSLGVLPGLQGLTNLTRFGGGWLSSDGPVSQCSLYEACPHITDHAYSYGCIPCSALPNLLHLRLCNPITSDVLAALCRHCPHLQSLQNTGLPKDPYTISGTLPAAEPVANRVAAARSLSDLHCLTALDFSVSDNAEMIALSEVTSALARRKLTEARVIVRDSSQVSNMGLSSLAQMSGIQALHVWLLNPELVSDADSAQVFVAVLACVDCLHLTAATHAQRTHLRSAFEQVRSCGLPLPYEFSVSNVQ